MIVTCGNCGGPLDARAAKESIKCNYCGVTHAVEALPVQQAVPAGWQPPTVWVPPAEYGALAGQSLQYQRTARTMVMTFILISFAPMALGIIGVAIAGIVSVASKSSSGSSHWPIGGSVAWSGQSTLHCSGSDTCTASKITTSKLGVGIEALEKCTVELNGATVSGVTRAITAEDDVHVKVTGGTLRADTIAIEARDRAHVELHGVHIVVGENEKIASDIFAIYATDDAHVDLYDCTVEVLHGGHHEARAVDASVTSQVTFHGGKVTGHYEIHAAGNATIEAHGTDIAGRIDPVGNGKITGVGHLADEAPKQDAPEKRGRHPHR